MKTRKRGISLIVLAITIIVMIILASAIVLSLTNNNMVDSAKEATAANDLANAKHAVAVAKGEWELGERNGYRDSEFDLYAEALLLEAGITNVHVSKKGAVFGIYKDAAGKTAHSGFDR